MANRDMCLLNESGELFTLYDSGTLQAAVSVENGRLCIDREVFEKVLEQCGMDGSIENFWLGFGGYMKMPGIGTSPNLVYVNYDEQVMELTIFYENVEDHLWEYIYKNLP